MRITDGPKIVQPPTVLQSADAVELKRALAQRDALEQAIRRFLSGAAPSSSGKVFTLKDVAELEVAIAPAPEHPDTRRLDHLQKLIDDAKSDGNNLTIFPRKGDDRQTIREYLDDAMKEADRA